jgi:hypothetical protein
MEDETKRMALMLHPAAAPLFAYMLTALQRFNLTRPQDIDDSIDTDEVMDRLDTSEKRAKLAEAFGLTGPKGERWLPRGRDSSLAAVFELEVQRELINGGHDESASGQVLRGAVRKGLLRTFFSRHGFEYEPGVRIHKDQMTALKKTLRAIGVRYLQDEKQ